MRQPDSSSRAGGHFFRRSQVEADADDEKKLFDRALHERYGSDSPMFRTLCLVPAAASAIMPAAKRAYWHAGRKLRAPGPGSRIG